MSYYLHASHKNKTYAAVHNMTGRPPGNCHQIREGSAVGAKMQQLKNTVMDCYTVFFHAGHATVSQMETVRVLPSQGSRRLFIL